MHLGVNNLQPHQILRLPRKRSVMIDPHHIWNVIYNARSNRHQPPTSPNTAPATQKECDGLIRITYETSFTMRGATGINLQPHQILRLPRKRSVMIDPHHIWNVIYNARSNRHQPPTSPNTAPATQNDHPTSHRIGWKQVNVISNARPIRPWSETDPTMIRAWSDPENAKLNPPRRQGYFSHSPGADSVENCNVSRSGHHSISHVLRMPGKVTHELHQMLRLPRKVTHELHQMLHLPQKMTHELHQMLHLPQKNDTWTWPHLPQNMTHELHQMLHLPQNYYES